MTNPNGLTDAQIAARMPAFVGALMWNPPAECWMLFSEYRMDMMGAAWPMPDAILLPGEPGTDEHWPPPVELRHEWEEGDRAWIRTEWGSGHKWQKCTACTPPMTKGGLWFHVPQAVPLLRACGWLPIDTPALYIPEAA